MSRSYKHTPYCGDQKHNKRIANHKVRQYLKTKDLSNGSCYKKLFDRYDICDFYDILSFEDYWERRMTSWQEWGYRYEAKPTRRQVFMEWKRLYVMK